MFYLFDSNENLIQIIDRDKIQEATRSESINTAATLEALVKMEPAADAKYIAHKDILNKNQINLYKITTRRDTGQGRSITGVESAYDDLLADGYIRDIRPTNQAPRLTLTRILQGSRWEPGTVEVTKTITTNFYFVNRISALQKIINATGGEVRFRIEFNGQEITARYVDILGRLGKDRGKRYAHGSNLLSVIREEQSANIVTALVGRGKGEQTGDGYGRAITFRDVEWSKSKGNPVDKPAGQEFVEIPEATATYGYPNGNPRIDIAEFSEIEDPEQLLQATYDLLATSCRPLVSYEADVKDIGDTGLGDTVGIRRPDLGIAYKTRIRSRTINLLNPIDIKVQLGDEIQDFRTNQINRVKEQVRKAEIEAAAKIESVREEARAAGSNLDAFKYELRRDNEYGLPPGTYHFDKPIDQNPTYASWETAGYEYKSNSKNPDGSWNWTTIATPNGYIAESMFADSITANLVKSGMLMSDNGQTWIDMENGTFNFLDRLKLDGNNELSLNGHLYSRSGYREIQMTYGQVKIYDHQEQGEIFNITALTQIRPGVLSNEVFIVKGEMSPTLCIAKSSKAPTIDVRYMEFSSEYDATYPNATREVIKAHQEFEFNKNAKFNSGLSTFQIADKKGNDRIYLQDGTGVDIFLEGNIQARNDLTVLGAKNAAVRTEHYGTRALPAYETAEYYFGDIGTGKTEDGSAKIAIEKIFKEVVNTEVEYQVFIQAYGPGQIWVEERNKDYFTIRSSEDIEFGWELKAKRRDYENSRLEKVTIDKEGE